MKQKRNGKTKGWRFADAQLAFPALFGSAGIRTAAAKAATNCGAGKVRAAFATDHSRPVGDGGGTLAESEGASDTTKHTSTFRPIHADPMVFGDFGLRGREGEKKDIRNIKKHFHLFPFSRWKLCASFLGGAAASAFR